jgi:hypothetical protein
LGKFHGSNFIKPPQNTQTPINQQNNIATSLSP